MSASASEAQPAWSPYGLEAHRVALLRQRTRLLAAAILVALLLLTVILFNSIRTNGIVSQFGGGAGGNTVDIPVPGEKPRPKPTTLTVSPGRTAVLDTPIQNVPNSNPRGGSPAQEISAGGVNWAALITTLGPPLVAAFLAWQVGRKKLASGLDEVNLGVYKGAMPLEMLTAQHKKYVFTPKMALTSLFGKGRDDLLTASQPLVMLQRRAARMERVR